MAEVSHNEHRKRLREQYMRNIDSEMSDREMLELLLTYAIPRKDVKPYVYTLLNEYKTIENILNADINRLMNVEGIGETSAIMLNLLGKIYNHIEEENKKTPKSINNIETAKDIVVDHIGSLSYEKFIAITLGIKNKIINIHDISDGSSSYAFVDKQKLLRKVLNDGAISVIIAHNHPNGNLEPSAEDLNTTVNILGFLRELDVKLIDHIIASKNDSLSLAGSIDYANYFDEKKI